MNSMARPKNKSVLRMGVSQAPEMSQAFANKSHQEQEKVQLKVASVLTEDLVRLFEEEIHTDFIITNGTSEVRAHHCILQARAKHLWPESLVYSMTDTDGSKRKCLRMNNMPESQIRDFVRQLYSVKDSELLFEEFLPHMLQESNSDMTTRQGNHDGDIEENKSPTPSSSVISKECCTPFTASNGNLDTMSEDILCKSPTDIIKRDENCAQCEQGKDIQNQDVRDHDMIKDQHKSLVKLVACIHPETTNPSDNKAMHIHTKTHDCNLAAMNKDHEKIVLNEDMVVKQENCVSELVDNNLVMDSSSKVACEKLNLEARTLMMVTPENKKDDTGPKVTISISTSNVENLPTHTKNEEEAKFNQSPSNGLEENTEIVKTEKDSSEASNLTKESHYVNPYSTCSPLGSDLLSLYLMQQSCDCCLSVEGVHFLAHKCVLSARSPYFNAMFGGGWSESDLEVVTLEGVSASAMEKVLLFFYGGVTDGMTSSDIFDLFIVADMYGVETIKLALQFFLKKDMCHFFHKPCTICIGRAPEALNLCHNFHLEELQDRLLKWVSKHFTKIWCTKTFASLMDDVHQLCVAAVVNQMTEINVLDIIMDCDKLTTSLPRIKWTESILCLTTQLMDLAIEYTSTHFIKVIHAPEFLTWAKIASWKASALEEIFNSVIDSLPVDTAISVYQTLLDLKCHETAEESCEQNLLDLLETMIKRCEKFLKTHIFMVTRSKQWSSINKSFQSQILENSSYLHLDHFPDPKPKPKRPVLSSSLSKPKLRSVSPSSVSSSSSSSQRKTNKKVTMHATSQVQARLKASTDTSTCNSNVRDKSISSPGKNHFGTSRKQTKPLKTLVQSSPKSSVSASEESSNSERKATTANLDVRQKDNSDRQSPNLMHKSNSPSDISTVKLSTKLPSDKKSMGVLGKSPPSRLPIKMPKEKTPEKLMRDSHQHSPENNSALRHSSSQLSVSDDHQVLTSDNVERHEQDPQQVSIIFMTQTNTEALSTAKFSGSDLPEESVSEESQIVSGNASLEVDFCNHSCESSSDPNTHHNATEDDIEITHSPTEDYVQNPNDSPHRLDGCTAECVEISVQQETNFMKNTKPLKISFVLPSDDKDMTKPL